MRLEGELSKNRRGASRNGGTQVLPGRALRKQAAKRGNAPERQRTQGRKLRRREEEQEQRQRRGRGRGREEAAAMLLGGGLRAATVEATAASCLELGSPFSAIV